MRRIVLAACIALTCASVFAQEDIYSRIKPLEESVTAGTATREQQLDLARLYMDAARYYEAGKLAKRLLMVDATDAEAIAIRDQAQARLKEASDRLIADAEAAVKADGATDAERLALANAYFDAGRYQIAADTYAKLPEATRDRETRLRYARSLSWSGRMDAAERLYADLAREESTPELELEYGRLLSWMGASVAARERLERAYAGNPSEEAAVAVANAKAWSGDREGAIALLTTYTSEHPSAVEAVKLLGELKESPELRLERVDRMIAMEPYNLALRVHRARLYHEAGQHGEALNAVQFVRDHTTSEVEGLDELERSIRSARDTEMALLGERMKALGSRRNTENADEMLSLAKGYTALGEYDEAIDLYADYLRARPDDFEARIAYARVLSWDKRWTAAERQYQKILDQHPDRADLRLAYAQILSYDRDYTRAVPMFSSLTDLSDNPRAHLYPDVPPKAHFNLGQIYRWFGWDEHAVEQQNRAIALDQGYLPAREELDRIRHLRPSSHIDARYSFVTDSNDFTLKRLDLEGELWRNRRTAVQASLGRHTFEHGSESVDANSVSVGLATRRSDRWTVRGRVGLTMYDEDLGTRPYWGVGMQWLPSLQSRTALDYNRYDLVYDVFTLASLTLPTGGPNINFRDPIHIDEFRAHYDRNAGGIISYLGDATYGFVSDDNRRTSAHGLVTFRVLRSPFVALKADGRYLSYDFRTNRYWSPEDYKSLAGVLQVGQNVRDRFFWNAELKYGRSWEGDNKSDLRAISARVTVPITDAFDLLGYYGYGKSGRLESILGDANTDFVNYWQRQWYVGVRIKRLFAGDDNRGTNPYYYDERVLPGSPVSPMGETP